MEGAIVKAYAQPNGGYVILEIFVGDKRRGMVSIRPNGEPVLHSDSRMRDEFLGKLRNAAIEAGREAK